ncbi:MAG: TetR/AcrR family transcriptional regulator [Clostridia bacterium]|nr:TetR/AcrR family transcriptional regulator [Clostridia bacterium]
MQYLKKEVKERILCAAMEEFKQYGYADASIRNIANNAEISLGNIYRYFANKEALYLTIINPLLEGIQQVIEKDFVFDGRTMKEISEVLVTFLMDYSDEIIVIRKGNSIHYDNFMNYIVKVASTKVREMMTNAFPQIQSKIQNEHFYDVIAESFLTALFKILHPGDSKEVQERNVRELVTFYFGHMHDRFNHFDM